MNKDIIKKIANNFGIVNQENKLIEELSELIKELSILHQENSKDKKDNVIEEMSDVIIVNITQRLQTIDSFMKLREENDQKC